MSTPGPIRRAWLQWKSLKFPWRKKFLAGLDLQGNTYWEFRDTLNPGRMRRIVQYPTRSLHYSEVTSKISPSWHQWLRHTRVEAPTLTEQSQDLVRQKNLKVLAAQADARWAAKESYLSAPTQNAQPLPPTAIKDPGGYSKSGMATEPEEKQGVRSPVGGGLDDTNQITGERLGDMVGDEVGDEAKEKDTKADRAAATMAERKQKDNPWKNKASGASETWQPEAWTPGGVTPRKR